MSSATADSARAEAAVAPSRRGGGGALACLIIGGVIKSLAGLSAPGFDEQALKRGVSSLRHPLARALVVLTLTTGLVDAVSYLALGHVFTANMTGNVVLLGFGVAGSGGLPVVAPLVSLAAFVLGAGAAGRIIQRFGERHPALVAAGLGLEVSLLAIAAILAAALTIRANHASGDVLIALMAFAMGARSAVVQRIGVPGMPTTVVTMTLAGLTSSLAHTRRLDDDSVRLIAAVLAMFLGALIGALLLKVNLYLPLVAAAGLATLTGLAYLPIAQRLGRAPDR